MSNAQLYVPAGTGRAYWGAGDRYTFLVTGEESGGSYFTMEALVPPGGGPPPHIHHREEEQFYILEDEVTFRIGIQTLRATTGDLVHVQRETTHQFRNDKSTGAKMLITYAPAGLEGLFQKVFQPVTDPSLPPPAWTDEDAARFVTLESKYGLESLPADDPRLQS